MTISATASPPSRRNGLPVWPAVAPAMAEPEEPVPPAAAAVVAAVAVATSTTGSLVIVKVADPLVTDAPLTACSPEPVTM